MPHLRNSGDTGVSGEKLVTLDNDGHGSRPVAELDKQRRISTPDDLSNVNGDGTGRAELDLMKNPPAEPVEG